MVLTRSPLLTLEVTSDQGVVTIHCHGEIDLSNSAELWQAIEWSLTPDLTELRIDMSKLSFLDSSGAATLLAGDQACARWGARFGVIASPAVRRVVELLAAPLPLTDVPQEAAPTP